MAKPLKRIKKLRAHQKPKKLKMKTKQSAAKRYNVLGSGKVKCPCANRSHMLAGRSRSGKNRRRKGKVLCMANAKLVRRCLPNSF